MTDYDPNYTPEDGPWGDGPEAWRNDPEVKRLAKKLIFGCLVVLGLVVAAYFYVAFALVCGVPGAKCIWPFNH
jgi:hypothetical protein